MTSNDTCESCGKEFDRTDLEFVELGSYFPKDAIIERINPQTGEHEIFHLNKSLYACHNCAVLEKLSWYKFNYELARNTIEELKVTNNNFRTLMLSVETMQRIGNEPAVSVKTYIRQHRPGWEALPLDTLMLFLELFQSHASIFAEIINKKASQSEIEAANRIRTETATKKHKAAVEKDRVEKQGGLTGEYTADERKAMLSLMKSPIGKGKTEAQIYAFIKGGMSFKG